ncbi:hypothetical protein IMCC26134_11495 [Verrucomicrobia bacterium IMCC26134]|nr:hypothetical protein IMCC26134_11495 [Verrucomicrobia bacterium IMCC26134]
MHPRILMWMELGGLLADAAEAGALDLQTRLKPRRRGSYTTRRPGVDTPLWNVCAKLIGAELGSYGSKVRLARYLGIPKQRLTDFLKSGRRMPDAETMLQIMEWLAQKRAGVDLSLSAVGGARTKTK